MSAMEVSNLTRNFLHRMLDEGKRFDGRDLLDLGDFEIEYEVSNMAEGSARVRLGKTEVIAGVKLAPGAPYPDSLESGNLIVSGDLLPLASPRFESGPPRFEGIEIPRLLDRMIRECGMIDFEKLVIEPKEKVWSLYIDFYPINDDGSLMDAAGIACVAALKKAIVPMLNKDGNVDYEKKGTKKVPLNEEVMPVSFTFYKLGDKLILHPTREEEEACEGKITFGASKWNGKLVINSCQKGWEKTFSKDEIGRIMDIIPKKYEEVIKKLDKFI